MKKTKTARAYLIHGVSPSYDPGRLEPSPEGEVTAGINHYGCQLDTLVVPSKDLFVQVTRDSGDAYYDILVETKPSSYRKMMRRLSSHPNLRCGTRIDDGRFGSMGAHISDIGELSDKTISVLARSKSREAYSHLSDPDQMGKFVKLVSGETDVTNPLVKFWMRWSGGPV